MQITLSVEELSLLTHLVAEKINEPSEPPLRSPGSGWVVSKSHSMSSAAAKALMKKLNNVLINAPD